MAGPWPAAGEGAGARLEWRNVTQRSVLSHGCPWYEGVVMFGQGRARRAWSRGIVLGVLAAAAGCAKSSEEAPHPGASEGASRERAAPEEQVVQRVRPAQATTAPASVPPSAPARSPGEASRPNRPASEISSKHLEAELNRLEAELGR